MRHLVVGDLGGFRHRGQRQVQAVRQQGRAQRAIDARVPRRWRIALVEMGEVPE
jgi:hypothetical protein